MRFGRAPAPPGVLRDSDAGRLGHAEQRDLPGWTLVALPVPLHAAAQLHDGTLLAIHGAELFASGDGGRSFVRRCTLEPAGLQDGAVRLTTDREGRIYVARRESGAMLMSSDGGWTFDTVLDGLGNSVRGFTQDSRGRLYTGSYDFDGPAKLYASDDGSDWRIVKHWDARHVHDVRVNPHNDWLYVVMGEGNPQRTKESHSVYRSKDQGGTFTCVFTSRGRRPLFTAINFDGPRVLLGTDHAEGDNYIASFVDHDEGAPFEAEPLYVLPGAASTVKVQPFVYFMEWMGNTLFVGARGSNGSFLLASHNLRDWELAYAIAGHARTALTCTSASQGSRDGRPLLINGVPGLAVIATEDERSPGFALGGSSSARTVTASGATQSLDSSAALAAPVAEMWGLPQERAMQAALLEIDRRYEHDISGGYFFRANPLFHNKVHWREALAQMLHLDLRRDCRVLDYGCGTGQFMIYLATFGFTQLHGWDHNERWLKAGRLLAEKLGVAHRCSFTRLDKEGIYDLRAQADEPFDVIVMFGLIYGHGLEIEAVLRSVAGALRPGGMFIANDNVHDSEHVRRSVVDAGLRLLRHINVTGGAGKVENQIYFCQRALALDSEPHTARSS